MGLYAKYILPRLINFACGAPAIESQRRLVVPRARGRVLEIGMGSGLNLPHYDPARIERVIGLDPAGEMLALAKRRARQVPFAVEFLELAGEALPLSDASIDSVLVTYALCTIADAPAALAQMRRVLKPGGRLIFCEHGRAPDAGVRRWQDRLTPAWKRIGGGCHLNRDIPALIEGAGFHLETLEAAYLQETPRFAGFTYWGSARLTTTPPDA